jgi:hypothetical protein
LKFFFPPIEVFQGVAGKGKSPQADQRPLRPLSRDFGEAARDPAPAAPGTSRFAARDDRRESAPVEREQPHAFGIAVIGAKSVSGLEQD